MIDVLVVEDEDTFREFLALALNLEGFNTRSVKSGEQALAAMNDAPPDMVILDLSMPLMSGWDVLRYMRADPRLVPIPVLVLTANADEETRRRSLEERANGLLVKPVALEEVLQAIQDTLNSV